MKTLIPMKEYRIKSCAPGSEGELYVHLTDEQFKLFQSFVEQWNYNNQGHCEPYMTITEYIAQ